MHFAAGVSGARIGTGPAFRQGEIRRPYSYNRRVACTGGFLAIAAVALPDEFRCSADFIAHIATQAAADQIQGVVAHFGLSSLGG
jgi:hypothetical protein